MAEIELERSQSALSNNIRSMSRLQQMQADLQRKMMKEKEEKLTKLYEDNQNKVLDKVRNGSEGNVRRFFNERRQNPNISLDSSMTSLDSYLLNASHGRNGINLNRSIGRPIKGSPVGWDKSFPLVPIERTNSSGSSGYESVNGKTVFSNSNAEKSHPARRPSLERKKTGSINGMTMRRSKSQILDSAPISAPLSQISSPIRGRSAARLKNDEKMKIQQEIRKRETELMNKIKQQQAEIDKMKQEKIKEEKAHKARLMRKPIPGTVKAHSSAPVDDSENIPTTSTHKSAPTSPAKVSFVPPKKKLSQKVTQKEKVLPRASSTNPDFPACGICGRHFAPDRIEKHVQVCAKTASKKRKVFDPVKMRTQGTEMENFVTKKGKTREVVKKAPVVKEVKKGPQTKSNWREKHETFLQAIRQAKVVQQHVAAGGKASDLPPPPPMDTSDYIQCPHCGRKFNEGVAERHIPKCQNIKSNKK